ncbi:MAG TPA: glycoside hydrolase family 172 protein [Flavisolibacter sp.]|nr:glycoside hydrolase family 172 protein [Flavisolibacter sp.]
MKHQLFILFLICSFLQLSAQTDNYRQELLNLADISRLPLYRTGEMHQLSSYDRTGGNDDGFSGKYSAVRKEAEGLVLADLKGPGVINRIWTPTPEADTVKFYFDGETTPRINIPFIDLFSGKVAPFLSPLSGSQLGGFYCFLPIPYEKSLKIIYTGKNLRFHQTQYRNLTEKEKMQSFSTDMFTNYRDVFDKIAATWNKQRSPLAAYGAGVKSKKVNLTLRPGVETNIFTLAKGGRIVGIELGAGSDLLQAYRKIMLTARWDGETKNAIDLPLHDFFGFAFGKPAAQSVVLGSDNNKLYSYLPMPFDRSAKLALKYDNRTTGDPSEILLSGTIYYTENGRDEKQEGKFYAQARREYNIPQAKQHLIANIKGRGHYVGTILQTQGLEEGSTYYFEGDDRAYIDGDLRLHGTGSEDYFNGGYYAVTDKWDRGISLPFHGALTYDLMTSRTGGYRFYLTDKLNFRDSFRLTIEHQPEDKVMVKTDYTSVAFFYADKPQFENTEIRIDDKVTKVPYRHKLTPQGMVFSLYWFATADYQDPAIVFGLKKSDAWMAKIDIEAVPIVQVSLNGLDKGQYKVYVNYGRTEKGAPFSVWQRSKQISDWIPTDIAIPTNEGKEVYAGEIEITDELKTITLRKRVADDASVKVYSFLFEPVEEK